MNEFFIGQKMLVGMMEALKKQLECVDYAFHLYAHNAQLLAIATQSLSIELSLLNLLNASSEGLCYAPWKDIDVRHWKEWLAGYDTDKLWGYWDDEDGEGTFPLPTEFDISSTLIKHHVLKENADGRAIYDRIDGEYRNDNANALDFALGQVGNMCPHYASEVAEDAILQLGVTFAELERLMLENDPQLAKSFVETRTKAGRKAVSCFTQKVPQEVLSRAFRSFCQGLTVEDGEVRMGKRKCDFKCIFVLLCYRFIEAGLMLRKLNVSCYSNFIFNALELEVNYASFRKSMNNWMQKIDLYGCTFHELTREQVSRKRHHENQLTPDDYDKWLMIDHELDEAIARSGVFEGIL
jgi:hypothetical protein